MGRPDFRTSPTANSSSATVGRRFIRTMFRSSRVTRADRCHLTCQVKGLYVRIECRPTNYLMTIDDVFSGVYALGLQTLSKRVHLFELNHLEYDLKVKF